MGVSVREKTKGSGVWFVYVQHNGIRKSRRIGSKQRADKIARDLDKQILAGKFVEKPTPTGPTFREQSKKWLDLIGLTRKGSTRERYQQVTRDFLGPFSGRPVTAITRKEVRDFFLNLARKGHSRNQLDMIRACLRGPLEQAYADGIISTNPTDRVLQSLNLDRKKAPVAVMNATEQVLFLDTARTTDPEMYPLHLFLLRTGARLGEGLGLQWQDIDFDRGLVWIRRTYRRGIFTTPKNGKARPVQLSGETVGTLKGLWVQKGGLPEQYVFAADPEGTTPYHQNSVRNRFKAILKKAGLDRSIRIHGLRHAYITNRLSLGHPLEQVSKEAGHSSVDITSTVYSHWIPDKAGTMIDDLDRLGRAEIAPIDRHPGGTLWHPEKITPATD